MPWCNQAVKEYRGNQCAQKHADAEGSDVGPEVRRTKDGQSLQSDEQSQELLDVGLLALEDSMSSLKIQKLWMNGRPVLEAAGHERTSPRLP